MNTSIQTTSVPTNALQQRMKHLAEKADIYLRSRGYEVNQRNGQRISILSNQNQLIVESNEATNTTSTTNNQWQNEVFVGKIPRELFEDDLLPFMEQAGPVKQIRLMMDFSGTNRGFGFVKFLRSADAAYACEHLSGLLLRPDAEFPIGIKPSFDNKILFFGRLPLKLTKEKLLKELNRVLDGVVDAKLSEPSARSQNLATSPAGNNIYNRFAFVSFQTHDHATQARRILLPGNVKVFGRPITVDWARPEAPAMNQAENSSRRSTTSSPNLNSNPIINISNICTNNNNIINQSTNRLPPVASSPTGSLLIPNLNPPISSPDILMPIDFSPPVESSFFNPIDTWDNIFSQNESILGEKAKEMLELTIPDQAKIITVCNIKSELTDLRKLKHIFELNGQLQILKIMPSGVGSVTIEYASPNQAEFMVEAIILMHGCFDKLASQNQVLMAFRGTMVDVNANYQLPLAYYTKQPLISQ